MRIAQYKLTPIAMAPDELAKAINKYSNHYSEVFGYERGPIPPGFDLLCTHNRAVIHRSVPTCILYHSEPQIVDLTNSIKHKMVVAQYQATLPEFADCIPMRNVIDYNQPMYDLKPELPGIRIGYSPSRKEKMGLWHDKGYAETVAVLQKIQEKHNNVSVDIITGVSLEECIRRKSLCNIVIDECVTGSYHRSGLEGLALGKLTICHLSPAVEKVLNDVSKSCITPFHNIPIGKLETELDAIISAGKFFIDDTGMSNRKWMEDNWNPEKIIEDYIQIYEQIK